MGKMSMVVPLAEMCKITFVRKEVLKAMNLQDEHEYPLIVLNTLCNVYREEESLPFYISLWINGLHLDNYMLDFGSSINVMPLKVIKQLGFQVT
jgi:hypothetical protein